jgi:sugar-specific transcriptional regulator TrmB
MEKFPADFSYETVKAQMKQKRIERKEQEEAEAKMKAQTALLNTMNDFFNKAKAVINGVNDSICVTLSKDLLPEYKAQFLNEVIEKFPDITLRKTTDLKDDQFERHNAITLSQIIDFTAYDRLIVDFDD